MRRRPFLPLVVMAVALAIVGQDAGAADFSPTMTFRLSDTEVGGNPSVEAKVAQDKDEVEIRKVELRVPAGYTVPIDEQIPSGQKVGEGTIVIEVGPRCRNPNTALSGPATVPITITERDRTSEEQRDGDIAVYTVDYRPVTSIDIHVKGSTAAGYTLGGNVPSNEETCPPLTFTIMIAKTTPNGVQIVKNPSTPGTYTFAALLTGADGSVASFSRDVVIGKAKEPTRKKRCKDIKNRAKRKRCRKRRQGRAPERSIDTAA